MRVDGAAPRGLWPPAGGGLCRRVVKEKVLRIERPAAGGFLSLTGPLAPKVVVAASPQIIKRGRGWRRRLCRRVVREKVQRVHKVQRFKGCGLPPEAAMSIFKAIQPRWRAGKTSQPP